MGFFVGLDVFDYSKGICTIGGWEVLRYALVILLLAKNSPFLLARFVVLSV